MQNRPDRTVPLKNALIQTQKEIASYVRAIGSGNPPNALLLALHEAEKRQAHLQGEIEDAETSKGFIPTPLEAAELRRKLLCSEDPQEVRRILATVITRIEIDKDRALNIHTIFSA